MCWCLNVYKNLNLKIYFEAPSAFSLEEKAGKKKGTSATAAVFQGPLRPKKQAWFFFLELIAGQEKRTKKETLEKNPLH